MIPHREWFCEYEIFYGEDVLLRDDLPTRIVGRGKIRVILQDGRNKTLPRVLHIPSLAGNLTYVSKMGDEGVQIAFMKDT